MVKTNPEIKRMKDFRGQMVKEIPIFPNDKPTRQMLLDMDFQDLLIRNLACRLRFIRQAKRDVIVDVTAKSDPGWSSLSKEIQFFLKKVTKGNDLNPHLSLKAQKKGFSSNTGKSLWEDKDFLLNVSGFHHFHLGTTIEKKGHAARTSDVLFALVNREQFRVIGIFSHEVFENDDPQIISAERTRFWERHEAIQTARILPGDFYFAGGFGGSGITTNGTPTALVQMAIRYNDIIKKMNTELADGSFWINQPQLQRAPDKKIKWHLKFLDLGLLNTETNYFHKLHNGPN